ncbi:GNAT family N-acetyltransferase [Flavobacterium sp.]|uniref:GNAT family N-acetyltransferase n=1 Tax=Flavobacterium sp. TaxID=239 RepID=UPI00286C64A6|nr:GNAT family N-acetyltransferase [Flavobacterium sp.]
MEYSIKPFTKNNIHDLYVLYQQVYRKSLLRGLLEKKFDASYLEKDYYGYFAYDGQKPIAFYGVIPVLMRYKNQTEMAAHSVNTMTHPNYRGKGLFTKLAKQTYDLLQTSGISFVWGFPNQHSEPGFLNKLDWKYSERINGYSTRVARFSIENLVKKNNATAVVYQKYCGWIFNQYKVDRILQTNAMMPENAVTVDRNKNYYRYKSFSGSFVIELEGCLFWINIKNGLYLGDVEAISEARFTKALQKLKQLCRKAGISEIIMQTSPHTTIDLWMQNQKWNTFDSWIAGYMNLNSNFPLENLKFTLGDVDIF